jgi:sodium-dependent dicarboxylate transporter 2/3/5
VTRTQLAGFVLGVLVLFLFLVLSPIEPISTDGMRVTGVLLFIIIWWVTQPVGMPLASILGVTLLVLTGALERDVAFEGLGNYLVWFCVGTFGLAKTLELSGFIKRFSLWLLTRGFVQKRPWMLVSMIVFGTAVLGSLVTMFPSFILMTTLVASMLEQLGYKKGDLIGAALMAGMAWSVQMGILIFPFSSPINLLMIELITRETGYTITFVEWVLAAAPFALLGCLLVVLVLRLMRPNVNELAARSGGYLLPEYQKLGPWKADEKIALGVFLTVVIFWLLSSFASSLPGDVGNFFTKNVGFAVPPIIGAALLSIIRQRGKSLLPWGEWVKAIDWDSIFFIAAILVIGEVVSDPRFGLNTALVNIFLPISQRIPILLFVMLVVTWAVIQTNFMSNMATMYIVYVAMVPVSQALPGIEPMVVGFLARLGALMAFALPSATIVTGMVINQGWVPTGMMARYGFLLAGIMIILLSFPVYYWASFLF